MGAVTGFLHDGGYLAAGSVVADLYAGAGLFTAPLADAVGVTGSVLSVEGRRAPAGMPARTCMARPRSKSSRARSNACCGSSPAASMPCCLDPPGRRRQGGRQPAGGGRAPGHRYVSCDPASFARDVGYFQQAGWALEGLRAFDLYPHTHHLETVALLTPRG